MKRTIKAILACDEAGGVSKDGTLPWPKNSEDLKWFKNHTTGGVIIMGSTTWNDPHMPCPMPNRVNVVATSRPENYPDADATISGHLNDNIQSLVDDVNPETDIWIIGGPNIIEQTLGLIDEFYISRIPGKFDCDTFLPLRKIEALFKLSEQQKLPAVTFQKWIKRT